MPAERTAGAMAVRDVLDVSPEERAMMLGDLSELDEEQRVSLVLKICASLNLNPLTRPFEYLLLDGKVVLYARKDCAEQLRKIHNVSCKLLREEEIEGVWWVTIEAMLPNGRTDMDIGGVPLYEEGGTWETSSNHKRYFKRDGSTSRLRGDKLINAKKRAFTQAKRRVTLSICGLAMLEESELELVRNATPLETMTRLQLPEATSGPATELQIDTVRRNRFAAAAFFGIESAAPLPTTSAQAESMIARFEEIARIKPMLSPDGEATGEQMALVMGERMKLPEYQGDNVEMPSAMTTREAWTEYRRLSTGEVAGAVKGGDPIDTERL